MDNENLSKTIDEALEESAVSEQNTSNDVGMKEKVLAIVAHAGWLIAGMGFILLPAVIYLYADKKLPFVAKHAKQALKIQVLSIPLALIVMLCASFAGALMIGYGVLVLVGLLICCLYACYKALNGEEYNYPLLDGNFTRKKAMIAGGVLFFMLSTAFISSSGDKKEDDSKSASTSSSASKSNSSKSHESSSKNSSDKENVITYEEVSKAAMEDLLENNAAAAVQRYEDKYVKITDCVIRKLDSNGESVWLEGDSLWGSLLVKAKNDTAKKDIMKLSKGDSVVIYGKVTRVGDTLGYSVDAQRIVTVEDDAKLASSFSVKRSDAPKSQGKNSVKSAVDNFMNAYIGTDRQAIENNCYYEGRMIEKKEVFKLFAEQRDVIAIGIKNYKDMTGITSNFDWEVKNINKVGEDYQVDIVIKMLQDRMTIPKVTIKNVNGTLKVDAESFAVSSNTAFTRR